MSGQRYVWNGRARTRTTSQPAATSTTTTTSLRLPCPRTTHDMSVCTNATTAEFHSSPCTWQTRRAAARARTTRPSAPRTRLAPRTQHELLAAARRHLESCPLLCFLGLPSLTLVLCHEWCTKPVRLQGGYVRAQSVRMAACTCCVSKRSLIVKTRSPPTEASSCAGSTRMGVICLSCRPTNTHGIDTRIQAEAGR